MFFNRRKPSQAEAARSRDLEAQMAAVDRSQAVIEFQLDGLILRANTNFLNTLGYRAEELVGQHHRMFVTHEEAASADYRAFWATLKAGQFVAQKFKRISKSGADCWIQASYNPVLDENGAPYKVVKFAVDITPDEIARIAMVAEQTHASEVQQSVIADLANSLNRMARGDLTARIVTPFEGSFEGIRTDFNGAIDAMSDALSGISAATGALHSGANEIASASNDLSRRTEQQAASLEETAAALDQITATVRRSADGARQASASASGARADAASSGAVMREAVTAMGEIEQSSSQITNIIGVIDEIAFQTNLLALNAGVEAARAGDAGRGFAVVAQEVRALAQRSADAAKQIRTLIASSSSQVSRGVKLVGDTGDSLSGIVDKITEIDILISEIAKSAQEQATGLHQVNTAVNQMDQVTQQNAAMVEEASAAANSLKTETNQLSNLVARFQTHRMGEADARPETVIRPFAQPRALTRLGGGGGAAAAKVETW
ncbi:MAG: methyl-accepting chemotaxis protein [bacterium]|nr:methyl-accepting chemotaxis protein [bacterium]